jgi:hypothetical protein
MLHTLSLGRRKPNRQILCLNFNVGTMQDVADLSELDLQSVGARIFADYWQSLPKVDLIPMRASFDPAAVKALLPDMVIHDLSTPGRIHVRLAGTAVVEGYGREITGTNMLEFFDPEQRADALNSRPSLLTIHVEKSSGFWFKRPPVRCCGMNRLAFPCVTIMVWRT